MIIKGKKYRIGSWAQPYIEELLRGGYCYDPSKYIEGEYSKHHRGNLFKYRHSWYNAMCSLSNAYPIMSTPNVWGGNPIHILKKFWIKFLTKNTIEERDGYRLCRIIDRNLFFRPGNFPEKGEVTSCKYSIKDLLTLEVEEKLFGESNKDVVKKGPPSIRFNPHELSGMEPYRSRSRRNFKEIKRNKKENPGIAT